MCERINHFYVPSQLVIFSSCIRVFCCRFNNLSSSSSGSAIYLNNSNQNAVIGYCSFNFCYGKSHGSVIFSRSVNILFQNSDFYRSHALDGSGVVYGSCYSAYSANNNTISFISAHKCPESGGHDGVLLLQSSNRSSATNVNISNTNFYKCGGLIMCTNTQDVIKYFCAYRLVSEIYHVVRHQGPYNPGDTQYINIIKCTAPYGFGNMFLTTPIQQYIYNICFFSNTFSVSNQEPYITIVSSNTQCSLLGEGPNTYSIVSYQCSLMYSIETLANSRKQRIPVFILFISFLN